MKVLTVSYEYKQGLPDYSNHVLGLSAEVDKDETPEEAISKLKDLVLKGLGIINKEDVIVPPQTTEIKNEEASNKEDNKVNTSSEESNKDSVKKVKRSKNSKEKDEVVAEVKEVKSKNIPYDNMDVNLKAKLVKHLNDTFATWSASKPKEEIKKFSQSLNGKDFLDAKGNILDTFKTELVQFFK
jgi:uncharacterized protein YpuA (DUF1002 family)